MGKQQLGPQVVASPNESELSVLKNALRQVNNDMTTLSDALARAKVEEDAVVALQRKLRMKVVPLQEQKQRLEEEIAKQEFLETDRRRLAREKAERQAQQDQSMAAQQAAADWEKKNGYAQWAGVSDAR